MSDQPADNVSNYFGGSELSFKAQSYPNNLIIKCGTGEITINLQDGKVTLTDCTNDEAALAFWKAVESQFQIKRP